VVGAASDEAHGDDDDDETRSSGISDGSYDRLRPWAVGLCIAGIVAVGLWAVPGDELTALDRVYYWIFVAFAVGLAELFLLFMGLAVLGKIDLIGALSDKGDQEESSSGIARISFARLQAFLWTLIILIAYFHKAVIHEGPGLPDLNSNLILVMGVSGAVYLFSKQQAASAPAPKQSASAAVPARAKSETSDAE
jgi:hypothetical protein